LKFVLVLSSFEYINIIKKISKKFYFLLLFNDANIQTQLHMTHDTWSCYAPP